MFEIDEGHYKEAKKTHLKYLVEFYKNKIDLKHKENNGIVKRSPKVVKEPSQKIEKMQTLSSNRQSQN